MDKGGTKREILDAALELFSVQGYGATSVSQIADAALQPFFQQAGDLGHSFRGYPAAV